MSANAISNARQRLWPQMTTPLTARYGIKPLSKNWNDKLVALVVFRSVFGMRVVRRVRHFTQIELREQYENKCLYQCHEDTQRHQQDRRKPGVRRRKARQRLQHFFVRKQVSEKTNAERKRPDKITDQLNRKDQRRNPPDRTGEVFQVPEQTVLTDADVVVVKKRTQAERERHTRGRSRTHKQWEESHQIRHQDQNGEGHHYRKVLETVWADDVFDHVPHGEHTDFQRLLSAARFALGKFSFEDPDDDYAQNARDEKHHRVPGDRVLGCVWSKCIFGGRAERAQHLVPNRFGVGQFKTKRRFAEPGINQLDDDGCVVLRLFCMLGGFMGRFLKPEHQLISSRFVIAK